jgi:peroxiredoxin
LLLVFVGFVLLGAAAAFLLFGADLPGGDGREPSSGAVLDQVPQFPSSEPAIGQVPPDVPAAGGLEVGDTAVEFTLRDLDGEAVSLSDFRGRPVIVNFWATWCVPCRVEMPELERAYQQHADDGLAILALNQEETAEQARDYFDELGLTFIGLLDEKGAVARVYGSYFVLPTSYFVSPEGEITAVHRGPMTAEQIEGYLADDRLS